MISNFEKFNDKNTKEFSIFTFDSDLELKGVKKELEANITEVSRIRPEFKKWICVIDNRCI